MTATQMRRIYTPGQKSRPGVGGPKNPTFAPLFNAWVRAGLPISRREAIWQQIVDKINSVAEVRRTVIECKKRWHDCKRRTKEKIARNRKAALQTGGGSPAHQEALDHMEEMVAAVIPEEIFTGIQGQDSADYQETTHMQVKPHGEL
ncbi:hypothetical protein NDU88_005758 [Pleurodeles waltl]|uniref:Myb/SANT-like DNA-binding domain-containing protein n=1 Tax=Pleurodeles waltl TaxID=8319 RepID=A0AAV7VPG3_PLEWA|nr:hypothetical protein NDU88_005758 [Pleurodeles waltl]